MKEVFLGVLTVSLTCSLLLAPLFVFGKKLQSRYAAQTLYFLWLLLAIRMVLPLPLTGWRAPVTVAVPAYQVTIPATPPAAPKAPVMPWNAGVHDMETAEPEVPVAVNQTVELAELAATVWAAGAGLFLLWQMVAYLFARRAILRASCPATDDEWALLGRLCTDLGVGKALNLCRSERVESPLLLGLLNPMVVLPDRDSDPDELEAVLRHELCHLKRGDVAYKSFFLLVNALHWFNPLVWLMAQAASRNVEFCCDDQVLRNADAPTKKHYGEVLLYTAAGSIYPAFSTHFGSGKEQLRARLINLFQPKKNSALLVCAVAVLALLVGGAVAFESVSKALPTSPVLYTRAYDLSLNEGHDGYEVVKFRVVEYDRVTDVLGADGEVQTFTMAEDVRLSRSNAGNAIWAGEVGSTGRDKALVDFLYWPLFRSTLHLDQTDLIEIILNDAGEVEQMGWIQTPISAAEPLPTPTATSDPVPEEWIAELLETICSSPAHMSNPKAYIGAHRAEYDELLGYGDATVDYCIKEFEQGGQTDLRGLIMAGLCRELLGITEDAFSNDAGTGQGWYDAWVAHAGGQGENADGFDYSVFKELETMTSAEVDALALSYIATTGQFGHVYNLRPYMTTGGIDAAVRAFLDAGGDAGVALAIRPYMSDFAAQAIVLPPMN